MAQTKPPEHLNRIQARAPIATEKANGPRSPKGAETRARLLAAAKAIFEEHGFLDARISDIAERAGLSHGSFYHYFDSNDEIFREVAESVEDQLVAPLGSVILDPDSDALPSERIRDAIRLHMESYRREARIMGVIEQVSRYDEQVKAARFQRHRHYGELVEESIRRMQRHGLVDPDLDPVIAAAAVGSMTSRFPEMWFVEGRLDCTFDDGVEQLSRVFINALGLEDGSDRSASRRPRTR
jgi:AcrR family transcriptional regulator